MEVGETGDIVGTFIEDQNRQQPIDSQQIPQDSRTVRIVCTDDVDVWSMDKVGLHIRRRTEM